MTAWRVPGLIFTVAFACIGCDDDSTFSSGIPYGDGGMQAVGSSGDDRIVGAALFVFSGVVGKCPQSSPGDLHDLKLTVNGEEVLGSFGAAVSDIGIVAVPPGQTSVTLAYDWYGCTDVFYDQTFDVLAGSRPVLLVGGMGPYSGEDVGMRDVTTTYPGGVAHVLLANASNLTGVMMTLASVADASSVQLALGPLDAVGTPAQAGGSMVTATTDDGMQLTSTLPAVEAQAGVSTVSYCLYRESMEGPDFHCSWTIL